MIYIDYLKNKLVESKDSMNKKEEKYLLAFSNNLSEGISYYKRLFCEVKNKFQDIKDFALTELDKSEMILNSINSEIQSLSVIS